MTFISFANKGLIALAVAASGLFCASAAPAVPAAPAAFHLVAISFPSDPPGHQREAPGGGRILTPALLYTPVGGANPYGPAIVMMDQGPGTHPLEVGQATRFAAERLARKGYTVLSLYGGQERGYSLQPFAETAYAVRAALDYLEMSGYEDFVLAGQGYGAIAVANYLASSPDTLMDNGSERRVKAVVLLNPLTELRQYPRADLAERYEQRVAQAEASMKAGRGGYPNLMPGHGTGDAYDPWLLAGPYIGPAISFLDYWGPQAAQRNADLLTRLPVPALVLAGARDPAVSIDKLRALKTASTVDLQLYADGDSHFDGLETKVSEDIAGWLGQRGLGTRPGVRTQAVDAQAVDGRMLQGVLYTPQSGAIKNMPTLMLISGRTADTIQSSTQWMGWRLAQKGYNVIAIGMRVSGGAGFQSSTYAEAAEDIGRWVARAGQLGYKRVVLAGHSNGGSWQSNYIAQIAGKPDKRVAGVIYFAPTRDSPTYALKLSGEAAYAKDVARAREAIARGDGMREVIGLMSAQTFMDNNAPEAKAAMHTERIQQIHLPGLAIIGNKDALMEPSFVEEFRQKYGGELSIVQYPNGTHGLRENKNRLAVDVDAWMRKTFH